MGIFLLSRELFSRYENFSTVPRIFLLKILLSVVRILVPAAKIFSLVDFTDFSQVNHAKQALVD